MSSFDELAVEVRCAASYYAQVADATEILAARSEAAVFETTLKEVRASGKRLGEVYALLRALQPHEATVRGLIDLAEERAA